MNENMPVADAVRLRAGASIDGKYRLDALIAKGGMGSVWRARHVELGVEVAIKFVNGSIAQLELARARFAREAKAAAALRHPNVVDVRDYGFDGALPYLVMELLSGEDLAERLKREGRISLAQTAAIVTQVARALGRAHDAGIVHRDLKPGNVFLARIDGVEVAKLLDFGVAKDTLGRFELGELKQSNVSLVEIDGIEVARCHDADATRPGDSTQPGVVVGSPRYMSPEQLSASRDLDGRSDVWSLGVIAFRCLTGEVPFPGDMRAVARGILLDPIPRATRVAPDLPPVLDAFFTRALARNRDDRFATADEMAAALAAIAAPARPPPEPTPPSEQPVPSAPAAPEGDRDGRLATLPVDGDALAARRRRPKEAATTMRLTSHRLGAAQSSWRAALDATLAGSSTTARHAPPPEAAHGDSIPDPYAHPRPNRAATAGVVAAVAAACLSVALLARTPEQIPQGAAAASPASALPAPPDPPAAAPPSDPTPVESAPPSASPAPAASHPGDHNAAKRPPAKKPRPPSAVF